MKNLQLKWNKEDSLLRFHPWVFSGAIQKLDDGIAEGEVVRVVTSKGDFIAVGHYQQGSIAVRSPSVLPTIRRTTPTASYMARATCCLV